jgi:hypothetical protein
MKGNMSSSSSDTILDKSNQGGEKMRSQILIFNGWLRTCFLFAIIAFLVACGAGSTVVSKPSETKLQVASVEVSEGDSKVAVPEGVKKTFSDELTKSLYQSGVFQKGNELKLKYRFMWYHPGSPWGALGPELGDKAEEMLRVEAKYFDSLDKEIATIRSEGKVSKCANEIAEYTKRSFK